MEICQICKQTMEIITDHHCSLHGITREEYRAKYGTVRQKNTFRIGKRPEWTEAEQYELDRCKRRRNISY